MAFDALVPVDSHGALCYRCTMANYLLGVEGTAALVSNILVGAAVVAVDDRIYNGVSGLWGTLDQIPEGAVTLFDTPILIEGSLPYTVLYCPDDEWIGYTTNEEQRVTVGEHGKEHRICWFTSPQEWEEWKSYVVEDLTRSLKDHLDGEGEKGSQDFIREQVSKIMMLDHRNAVALGVKARGKKEPTVRLLRNMCREKDQETFDAVVANRAVLPCSLCGLNRAPRVDFREVEGTHALICKSCFLEAYQHIVLVETPLVWKHLKTDTLYVPFAAKGKNEGNGEVQVCYYKHNQKCHFNKAEDEFWIRPRLEWHQNDDGSARFSLYGTIQGLNAVPYNVID